MRLKGQESNLPNTSKGKKIVSTFVLKDEKGVERSFSLYENPNQESKTNPFDVIRASSAQVLFDTVEIPFKEKAHKINVKPTKDDTPPWETVKQTPSSNDENYQVKSVISNTRRRRKSLKIYSPDDLDFCQNVNPDLKSWLEAATPIPKNLYVLFEDKAEYLKRSKASKQKRPDIVEDIEEWSKVKARRPDLYPPTPNWQGDRPPSMYRLILSAYKKGYRFVGIEEQQVIVVSVRYWLTKVRGIKLIVKDKSDDQLDISAFECLEKVNQYDVWNGKGEFLLDYRPLSYLSGVKTIHQVDDTSEDCLEYKSWLLNNAFHNELNLGPYRLINQPDLTHFVNIDEVMYNEWLEDVSKFNGHVDFTYGNEKLQLGNGKYRSIFTRSPDALFGCNGVLPVDRFTFSDTKTTLKLINNAWWYIDSVKNNSPTSSTFLWLRFLTYVKAYQDDLITSDCLRKAGLGVYSGDVNSRYSRMSGSLIRVPDTNSFINSLNCKLLAKRILEKGWRDKQSSLSEVKTTSIPDSNSAHVRLVEWFHEFGSEGFYELPSGVIITNQLASILGHVTLTEGLRKVSPKLIVQ